MELKKENQVNILDIPQKVRESLVYLCNLDYWKQKTKFGAFKEFKRIQKKFNDRSDY